MSGLPPAGPELRCRHVVQLARTDGAGPTPMGALVVQELGRSTHQNAPPWDKDLHGRVIDDSIPSLREWDWPACALPVATATHCTHRLTRPRSAQQTSDLKSRMRVIPHVRIRGSPGAQTPRATRVRESRECLRTQRSRSRPGTPSGLFPGVVTYVVFPSCLAWAKQASAS
jgi:hypothetical protein